MTEQLKQATQSVHRELEAFLIPVIRNIRTKQEYIRLLNMFYGFYKPLEDAVDAFPVVDYLPDYVHRRKAALIVEDLRVMGEQGIPAVCTEIPDIDSIGAAFGALYVLEGSTLGGQHIAAMLRRSLYIDASDAFQGLAFFTGYRDDTGPKWKRFREVLVPFCADQVLYKVLVSAAEQTFEKMKAWAELVY